MGHWLKLSRFCLIRDRRSGSLKLAVVPEMRLGKYCQLKYDTYTFPDTGTGFLAAAQDTYKEYGGMRYAQFDM